MINIKFHQKQQGKMCAWDLSEKAWEGYSSSPYTFIAKIEAPNYDRKCEESCQCEDKYEYLVIDYREEIASFDTFEELNEFFEDYRDSMVIGEDDWFDIYI